jgi:hypothetical protein
MRNIRIFLSALFDNFERIYFQRGKRGKAEDAEIFRSSYSQKNVFSKNADRSTITGSRIVLHNKGRHTTELGD